MKMIDKNEKEIKKGDIVKIEGAYFKNDNGIYIVEHTPDDEDWLGNSCSLLKLNKNGKLKKGNIINFWPLRIFTNSWEKRIEGNAHNKKYATIEVQPVLVDFIKR